MENYIIKIDCTHKHNLILNDKKITKDGIDTQNPTDLALGYLVSIFPYIKNVAIVHKKIFGFTKKYLCFFCYNENPIKNIIGDYFYVSDDNKRFRASPKKSLRRRFRLSVRISRGED